jgi:hypothetical protein
MAPHLALDGGEQSASIPGWFTPGERNPYIHCVVRLAGPQGLFGSFAEERNILLLLGIEPQIFQPTA